MKHRREALLDHMKWRIRHARALVLFSLPIGFLGPWLLYSRYAATPDEALTVSSVFVVMAFGVFRLGLECSPRPAEARVRPEPPAFVIRASAFFSFFSLLACVACLLAAGVSALLVGIQRFAPVLLQGAAVAFLAVIGAFLFVLISAMVALAWQHRHTVRREVCRILVSVETTVHESSKNYTHWADTP